MTGEEIPAPRPADTTPREEPRLWGDRTYREDRLDRVFVPIATVLGGLVVIILTIALTGA